MSPIERKPLPPPGSSVTTITEADRAEMIAHANAVIDYYVNGPGSYWDAGTQKPLVSDDQLADPDTTVNDLKKFKARIVAAKQFADDPSLIMDSVIGLIDQAMQEIEEAARYNEGRDNIWRLPPDTADPIVRPKTLNNAARPIVFEEGRRAAPPQAAESTEVSNASPVRILSRKTVSHSPPHTPNLNGALAPAFGETAARRSDAQNIRTLSGGVMPDSSAGNVDISSLRIPTPPISPPQSGPALGLLTDKPMSKWILPPSVFGFSNRSSSFGDDVAHWPAALVGLSGGHGGSPTSVSDLGTSAALPIWSNEFRSPGGRSAFDAGSDGFSSDTPTGVAARIAALTSVVPTSMDARASQEGSMATGSRGCFAR